MKQKAQQPMTASACTRKTKQTKQHVGISPDGGGGGQGAKKYLETKADYGGSKLGII